MPTFDQLKPYASRANGQEEDTRSVLAQKLTSNAPKAEVLAMFRTWLEREGAAAPWQVLMQRITEGDTPDAAMGAAEEYARDQLREVQELVTESPILAAAAMAEGDGFRAFLAAKPTTGEERTMTTETKAPASAKKLPDPLPTTTYGGGDDEPGLYDLLVGWQYNWREVRDRLYAQVGDEDKAARIWANAEAEVLQTMQIENTRTDLYTAVAAITEHADKARKALGRLRGDLYDVEYAEGDAAEHVASFLASIRQTAAAASALLPTDEHGDLK